MESSPSRGDVENGDIIEKQCMNMKKEYLNLPLKESRVS